MRIQKFTLTTVLTLIYPFASPHILSAATLSSSNFLSLNQTTALHQSSAKSITNGQQDNSSDVLFQALQIAQSLDNEKFKAQALIDIASKYVALGEKEKASEILFQALKVSQALQLDSTSSPSKFDLLLDIAVEYAALGQKEKTSEVLSQALQEEEASAIRPYSADISGLSDIAVEYAALGQKEKATELFSQAFQAIQLLKNDTFQIQQLGIVAIKASQIGQFDQSLKAAQTALSLSQAIKEDTKIVDALTQTASYFIAARHKEKASEILSQTLQMVQSNEFSEYSRGEALIKISTGYLAAGQKEKAFEILHEVFQITQKLYLTQRELDPIVEAYAAAEQYDQLLLVSATINSETVASVLSAVSRKVASMGQYERAVKLAQAIGAGGNKSSALHEIVREAAEAEHYEQAVKIAQTLESDLAKTHALVIIADSYAATGQYDQALKLAESVQSDTKARIMATVADYYAATGQYDQALKLVQTIDNGMDNVDQADALISIANYSAIAGQKKRASELLTQAFQIVQDLPFEDRVTMVEIAIGFAAAGQYDQALKLASTIESSEGSALPMALVLTGIAAHYGAGGQSEDALKVLSQALTFNATASRGYRCSSDFVKPMLGEIVNKYTAAGQYNQSLQISQLSEDEYFNQQLFNEVILKYVEGKKKESRRIRLAAIPRGGCGA